MPMDSSNSSPWFLGAVTRYLVLSRGWTISVKCNQDVHTLNNIQTQ